MKSGAAAGSSNIQIPRRRPITRSSRRPGRVRTCQAAPRPRVSSGGIGIAARCSSPGDRYRGQQHRSPVDDEMVCVDLGVSVRHATANLLPPMRRIPQTTPPRAGCTRFAHRAHCPRSDRQSGYRWHGCWSQSGPLHQAGNRSACCVGKGFRYMHLWCGQCNTTGRERAAYPAKFTEHMAFRREFWPKHQWRSSQTPRETSMRNCADRRCSGLRLVGRLLDGAAGS
jgi:hypothetical protein